MGIFQYFDAGQVLAIVIGGLLGAGVFLFIMFIEARFRLFILYKIRARREKEYAEYLVDLQRIDAVLPACPKEPGDKALVEQCFYERVARMEKYSDAQESNISELKYLEGANLLGLCVRYRGLWRQFVRYPFPRVLGSL